MKKNLFILSALILTLLLALGACGSNEEKKDEKKEDIKKEENKDEKKEEEKNSENDQNEEKKEEEEKTSEDKIIKVGASPLPHSEILEFIKSDLKEQGYELEIVEFTDYITPNLALDEGSIDANFFQHVPYMENFAKDHKLNLVNVGGIHVEPMGAYSNKIKSIDELKDGDKISIPNDATNGGRALLLLQKHGLIKLEENAGLEATEADIKENKLNLQFTAIDAAQLPRTLEDSTISIINSNYALEAGFNPVKDSLIIESEDSPYVNVITVLEGKQDNEKIKTLVKTLQTDKVKDFINEKYQGSIVPSF